MSTCHNPQGDLVVEDLLGDFSIQTIVKSEPRPTVAPDQLEISKTSFFLLDLDTSEPLEASKSGLRSPLQTQDNFDLCSDVDVDGDHDEDDGEDDTLNADSLPGAESGETSLTSGYFFNELLGDADEDKDDRRKRLFSTQTSVADVLFASSSKRPPNDNCLAPADSDVTELQVGVEAELTEPSFLVADPQLFWPVREERRTSGLESEEAIPTTTDNFESLLDLPISPERSVVLQGGESQLTGSEPHEVTDLQVFHDEPRGLETTIDTKLHDDGLWNSGAGAPELNHQLIKPEAVLAAGLDPGEADPQQKEITDARLSPTEVSLQHAEPGEEEFEQQSQLLEPTDGTGSANQLINMGITLLELEAQVK